MLQLPAALTPLGDYVQFVLYRVTPDPNKPGKLIKQPCDYTGRISNAHDRSIWMDHVKACAWASHYGEGYGVGFVLTPADPFFLIDIDHCIDSGGMKYDRLPDDAPAADVLRGQVLRQLNDAFAGCAVETSTSGTGLHIIGCGEPVPHGKKNKHFGIEYYTDNRFVALTGRFVLSAANVAIGNAAHCVDPSLLQWLTDYYFPPKASGNADNWTEGPVPEWNGPQSDDELLRRALRSVSKDKAYKGESQFHDLWTANGPVLAGSYPPDPGSNGLFGESEADSALASLLAFWTGKDCERIERLMKQSALVRPKWDRVDYLPNTIVNACAVVKRVLQDKPLEQVRDDAPAITAALAVTQTAGNNRAVSIIKPEARVIEGSTIVSPEQQIAFFDGCVFVEAVMKIWIPEGRLLSQQQFDIYYGGYSFVMDRENAKLEQSAWKAFTQSRVLRQARAAEVCFTPKYSPGAIIEQYGHRALNTYLPLRVGMIEGDPTRFLRHLAKVLPDEQDQLILLSYMAACVQYKGTKFQWAPLIQGVPGNGKTILSECVGYCMGQYVHVLRSVQVNSQFNDWLYGNLLYTVEDIFAKTEGDRFQMVEDLKPMITNDKISVEGKGKDQRTRAICGNWMFNCNDKKGMRKDKDDRRLAMFFCAQQHVADLQRDGMGGAYMNDLQSWLRGTDSHEALGTDYGYAVVHWYLATWKIPDAYNPVKNRRAPPTSSEREAISYSKSILEQHVQDFIDEGRIGLCGGWLSSHFLKRYLAEEGIKLSPRQMADTCRNLGYVWHPAFPEGRAVKEVLPDARKSVLYVHLDSAELLAIRDPAAAMESYTNNQKMG